jgi:hypothetical protein
MADSRKTRAFASKVFTHRALKSGMCLVGPPVLLRVVETGL